MSTTFQGFPASFGSPIASQGNDFVANNKPYPGYAVAPTESQGFAGAWREINGAFWMIQNADFGPNGWQQFNANFPSWAFVLLSGGGLAMYTAAAGSPPGFSWTRNFYVDNSGVLQSPVNGGVEFDATTDLSAITWFNYLAFAASAPALSATNTTAMFNMLAAMSALNSPYGGGKALIPSSSFAIDTQPNGGTFGNGGFDVPSQTIVEGAGGVVGAVSATRVAPATFVVSAASSTVPNTLFQAGFGTHTSGGTYFRNIGISYQGGANVQSLAVNLGAWNSTCEDVVFYNCPVAAYLTGLSSSLRHCTIQYQVNATGPNSGPNGGSTPATALPMVILAAPQAYLEGPGEMQQQPVSAGGATGIVAVAITGISGGEHNQIIGWHISDFDYGITWAVPDPGRMGGLGSSYYTNIANNEIVAATCAIYLGLDGGGGSAEANGIWITNNILWQAEHASVDTYPVVYIDPAVAGQTITDVVFTANTIYNSLSDGVLIRGGGQLRFIGDTISGNTNANIHISSDSAAGAVGYILIQSCQIGAVYTGGGGGNNGFTATYGLLINANNLDSGSIIRVDNCAFSGSFGTAAVHVTGSVPNGAEIFIENCPGYNDQNTVISTTAPTSPTAAQAASGLAGGVNYFGPSIMMFMSAVPVNLTINGQTLTGITSGYFPILKPTDVHSFNSAPSGSGAFYRWVGK